MALFYKLEVGKTVPLAVKLGGEGAFIQKAFILAFGREFQNPVRVFMFCVQNSFKRYFLGIFELTSLAVPGAVLRTGKYLRIF